VCSAGEIIYYHNDLSGSPVAATNQAGQVIWRESYRPYGERLTNSPASSSDRIWFTSRHQDATTGLIYMGARYYDPIAGRFVSTDAKLFDERNIHSFNRYAYANNNPYKYVDPDGRQALPVVRPPPAVATNVPTAPLGKPSEAQQLRTLEGFGSPSLGNLQIPSLDAADAINFMLGGFPAVVGSRLDNLIFNANQADLKLIHSEETIKSGSNRSSYDYWKSKSTDEIVKSLRPGENEALRAKADGAVMNGNTRLQVLGDRQFDINKLPREPYRGQ
jgi:RHS repeat-associated protein